MDDAIKFIVHACCFLVLCEILWRSFLFLHRNEYVETIKRGHYDEAWGFAIKSLVFSYVMCILTDFLGLKDSAFVKSSTFRNVLSMMHGVDGLAAGLMGVAMYYHSSYLFIIAQLIISKFFLLSLLNRMILANKKTDIIMDNFSQTSKSYLHHVASFLFITRPEEILLTALWRTISMFGHSVLVLRGRVEPSTLSSFSWILAYLRIGFMFLLLIICFVRSDIRESFACSAIGHIAYTAVRLGPVFRLGSIYLKEHEKEEWQSFTDGERLKTLFSGKYKWLSLELFLLFSIIVVFGGLRLYLFISELSSVLNTFKSSVGSELGLTEMAIV